MTISQIPLQPLFILLFVYQVKHFLADYPLQTPYMLQKFKERGWELPLAAHAGVHALFTFAIAAMYRPRLALPLAIFDFTIHFIMDRIKASPHMLGRYKALSAAEYQTFEVSYQHKYISKEDRDRAYRGNKYFWWSLGFDQMVHHLTHYVIIFALVTTMR